MAETMIWMEAWDGSPVRVPESKMEQYAAEQEKIKKRMAAGKTELTPEENAFAEMLKKALTGK